MITDFMVILLLVGLSYLIKNTNSKYFDNQILFILCGLLVLVFYKTLNYDKLTNEGFENVNFDKENIQDLINSLKNKNIDTQTPDGQELIKKAVKVENLLTKQVELLTDLNAPKPVDKSNELSYDRDNLQNIASIQVYQNQKIKDIEDKINKARNKLQKKEIERNSKSYPKIPVYSSCVVSNASGNYSIDKPDTHRQTQLNSDDYIENRGQNNNNMSEVMNIIQNIADKGININLE